MRLRRPAVCGVAAGWALGVLILSGCTQQQPAAVEGEQAPAAATTAPVEALGTLDELGGVEWVLTQLAEGQPVPAAPEITLVVEEGRFAGTSGCNRYSAFGQAGENPGEMSLGQSMGTKMACPEEVMALEQSYLTKLQGVAAYRVEGDRLLLDWTTEEGQGTLGFSSRPRSE